MTWHLRRDRPASAPSRRESEDLSEPRPPLYRSPTLKALLSQLTAEVSHHILDLGAASGANVEFFSRFSCRLQIVDLLGNLASDELRSLAATDPGAAFRRVLPAGEREFNVVLAWDVLDHLNREQSRALFSQLARVCAPGALVLAFVSAAKETSALPLHFRIVDDHTLLCRPQTDIEKPGPQHPPAEVERMAVGFVIVHSVLTRRGVREFLFARRHDADG